MLTGSVSQAARNLFRTQPAISAQIAGLEDEVGMKLFERQGGRLLPVPEAHYLHEEATAIIERLNAADRTMKSIRGLDQGTIQMVSMPGPSAFLIPDLIAKFVKHREQVRVSLIARSSIQVQQLIAVQQYDVGLADVGFAGFDESPLVDHDILRLECLCAMPADDDLANNKIVTARDLSGKPMATLYEDHPNFIQTRAAFAEMNAVFNPRFEAQYFIPLLTYVERGLAYAIADPMAARSYGLYKGANAAIVFRPFVPSVYLVSSIMVPSHKPPSNLARAFIAELQSELRRLTADFL
jgi:DNA-binding transcriptional LysR family regulator